MVRLPVYLSDFNKIPPETLAAVSKEVVPVLCLESSLSGSRLDCASVLCFMFDNWGTETNRFCSLVLMAGVRSDSFACYRLGVWLPT